jgi:hypothetical protein
MKNNRNKKTQKYKVNVVKIYYFFFLIFFEKDFFVFNLFIIFRSGDYRK